MFGGKKWAERRQIAKLGELRDSGLLIDSEFQAQKQKRLDRL